jgi:saccharopepsin
MKVSHLFSTTVLVSSTWAAKLSLPLSESRNNLFEYSPSHFQRDERGQKVLNGDQISRKHPTLNSKSRGSLVQVRLLPWRTRSCLPDLIANGPQLQLPLFYTTNISLGTPPQSFRALIDLNWADLFVPSIHCGGDHCSMKEKYDSSASSTFQENSTRSRITYGPIFAYGILGSDTLTIADGLGVVEQKFYELRYYEIVWPDYGVEFFDSVLGLGFERPWLIDPLNPSLLLSPFRTMIANGILDENMFSISFPRNETETGNLTFGGVNENLFEGELISHPLSLQNTTNWQIHIESVSLIKGFDENDHDEAWENSGLGYTALMYTGYPGIILPYNLAESVIGKIHPNESDCTYAPVVDCDRVASLPRLQIGLNGHNVTISGEDYVYKWTTPDGACPIPIEECVLYIDSLPPRGGRGDEFPEDLVILGTSFLKKVYSVYNWDEQTISCKLKAATDEIIIHELTCI